MPLYTKPPIFKNGQVVSDISACRTLFGDYGMSYYLKLTQIWHKFFFFENLGHQVLQFTWNLVRALLGLKFSNACKGFGFFRLSMAFLDKISPKSHVVLSYKYLKFRFRSCDMPLYTKRTYFLWSFFLRIWTCYNGMPRNLGFVHNGMPVNAGGGIR